MLSHSVICLVAILSIGCNLSSAWIASSNNYSPSSRSRRTGSNRHSSSPVFQSSSSTVSTRPFLSRLQAATALDPNTTPNNNNENDSDTEYEYIEYDALTEADFLNTEWVVGTLWNDKDPKKNENVKETWVRLGRNEDGKNVCYWGTKQQGTWYLDVASQFLSISRESLLGKQIWACTVDDYYYLQGTVRGWSFWQAASVLGQWQAKRLGVDPEEAGVAPWFDTSSEDGGTAKAEEDSSSSE